MATEAEQGYNGWANYETWCMALWIDNDQGSYTEARELAGAAHSEQLEDGNERRAVGILADDLAGWQGSIRDNMTDGWQACVFTDLLGAAFGAIDWYEIATAILSE